MVQHHAGLQQRDGVVQMAAQQAIELQAPDCCLDVPRQWQVNHAYHDVPSEYGSCAIPKIGAVLVNNKAGVL